MGVAYILVPLAEQWPLNGVETFTPPDTLIPVTTSRPLTRARKARKRSIVGGGLAWAQ